MSERRAVRVSHELWKQIMTQGYTSGGWRCVKGLPEDAELVSVWIYEGVRPDPVFIFESGSWEESAEREIGYGENVYPECLPEFRTVECRTCRHWNAWGSKRLYKGTYEAECNAGVNDVPVPEDFGCTEYKPKADEA